MESCIPIEYELLFKKIYLTHRLTRSVRVNRVVKATERLIKEYGCMAFYDYSDRLIYLIIYTK